LRLAGRSWRAGDTEGLAVGQGYFSATPLQVARWIGAVANGGYLVRPQILLAPQPQVGQQPRFAVTDSHAGPHAGARLPISPANLNAVREGLRRAITDPDGTGHAASQIAWPTLAGKTGTAEVGPQQVDHAWFAGYAPADEARWAIVVALEHGGSGATAAGPIVRRLAQALDELGYTPAP
jgi:penicillin-binding protein 2